MCVLAIAWRAHPRWRLVVGANRDEFHDRPAEPLHRWGDGLLAGRDARAGGTWLAVNPAGRFAAVTNVRGAAPDPTRESRGRLIAELATGEGRYAAGDPAGLGDFNPFNAILIAGEEALFLSNRPERVRRVLSPGFHAMSNGPLDPPWRKSVRLREGIEAWLRDDAHEREALFAALREASPPAGTAEDPAAIFVEDPVYGTRCTTLVLVAAEGEGLIVERRFDPAGRAVGETALSFRWA